MVLSSTAFAADKPQLRDKGKTEYSYSPDSFCKDGAGKLMQSLNEKNSDKINEMAKVQGEIADLEAQVGLINSMTALRNTYMQSLQSLATSQTKAENSKQSALDDMRKVVRSGLVISVVGALLKDSDLSTKMAPGMSEMCSSQNIKDQKICSQQLRPEASNIFQKAWFDSSFSNAHTLNETIANFKTAYLKVKENNRASLKKEIQVIVDSIPQNIGPEAIFEILKTKSPNIAKILTSDNEGEQAITKCLGDKSQAAYAACEQILPALKSDPNFVQKINHESMEAVAGISPLAEVITEASKANLAQLNQKIKGIESQKPVDTSASFDKFNALVKDVKNKGTDYKKTNSSTANMNLDMMAQLFLENPTSEATSMQAVKANQDATFWEKSCTPPKTEDLVACNKLAEVAGANAEMWKKRYATQLDALRLKMKEFSTDGTSRFSVVEKLKKYVAEKYMRSCNKADTSNLKMKSTKASLNIAVDGECFHGLNSLNSIEGLGADLNDVVSQYKFAYDLSAKKDTTGDFSRAEMADYNQTCSYDEFGDDLGEVCNIVRGEKTARDTTKDSKDWQDFNEKYWVKYDASSPKGYTVANKKSNLRVFGEGVLPAIPQMIPMFFQNYATKSNIENLTTQALYQKQMLHNYDVYNANPWMYNYGYFGGIQGYGNYGLFGTSTTSTTTTGTANAGFNFGL